ncbi:MAG: PPC domain-containing DNA-binding protein [Ferruginibacter sp.]
MIKSLFALMIILLTSCTATHTKIMHADKSFALRLMPGSDLRAGIENFVKDKKIKAGWLVTCAGSLINYNIRFANSPAGTTGSGHFEILSLSGILSENGSHIHISIADSLGHTIGGHLLEGCKIYTTTEIVFVESSRYLFTREDDGTSGYKELQIKEQ